MDVINAFPRLGPYVGVTRDRVIKFKAGRKSRSFRVIIFGAYDAFGLIGPEFNGIAILDEDQRAVLCDRIACESSGYFGPSPAQLGEFDRLAGLDWPSFREFVNGHDRTRYAI
jgi:hypothetical protein